MSQISFHTWTFIDWLMEQNVLLCLYNGEVVGIMYLKSAWKIVQPYKEWSCQEEDMHNQDMGWCLFQ